MSRRLIALMLAAGAALLPAAAAAEIAGPVERVIDGKTFVLAGRTIVLWGIDAPDLDQTCRIEDSDYDCGIWSRRALARLLAEHERIACKPRGTDSAGRTVAQCFAPLGKRSMQDLAAILVNRGWAIDWPDKSGGLYGGDAYRARARKRGLWVGSFVKPWRWRTGER